jgi:hypothetical protein
MWSRPKRKDPGGLELLADTSLVLQAVELARETALDRGGGTAAATDRQLVCTVDVLERGGNRAV